MSEIVVTSVDGAEVAVHVGVLLRAGEIAISVHDAEGMGHTAYLQRPEARIIRDALSALLRTGDEPDDPSGSDEYPPEQ